MQLLNPKVALFFLAFLPQFVDPDRAATGQALVPGAVVAMIGVSIGRQHPGRVLLGRTKRSADSP